MTDRHLSRACRGYHEDMILVAAFVIVSIAVGAAFIARTVRARITPRELRGDWWTRFESEFRAYARRSASPDYRRHHGTPPR